MCGGMVGGATSLLGITHVRVLLAGLTGVLAVDAGGGGGVVVLPAASAVGVPVRLASGMCA